MPKSDEEYDLRVPKDMAYIFSGAYVPLSCRLIEQVSPAAADRGGSGPDPGSSSCSGTGAGEGRVGGA